MVGLDTAIVISTVAAVVPFIEILLLRARRQRARQHVSSSERILEYGRGLKGFFIFGAGFFSFVALGTAGAFGSNSSDSRTRLVLASFFIPFILLYAVGIAEVFGSWIRFDSKGITKQSPWRGRLSLSWSEIRRIKYSRMNRWYVFYSSRGKIRISDYLHGLEEFLRAARQRVPPEMGTELISPSLPW